jgi:hypothetical protein
MYNNLKAEKSFMRVCGGGKKSYVTRELAEEALIEAHTRYDFGRTSGPVGVYLCEDCGHFHLTSQGPMNQKLAEFLRTGQIQKSKEALKWEEKFKKKR